MVEEDDVVVGRPKEKAEVEGCCDCGCCCDCVWDVLAPVLAPNKD